MALAIFRNGILHFQLLLLLKAKKAKLESTNLNEF